mmetsp:Transcript_1520/g.2487  ORF Transcript_1520/g.2487 Transcript_1520/m.2487 type:complete len:126 (+) Transcript_1520:1375-1752(+)
MQCPKKCLQESTIPEKLQQPQTHRTEEPTRRLSVDSLLHNILGEQRKVLREKMVCEFEGKCFVISFSFGGELVVQELTFWDVVNGNCNCEDYSNLWIFKCCHKCRQAFREVVESNRKSSVEAHAL